MPIANNGHALTLNKFGGLPDPFVLNAMQEIVRNSFLARSQFLDRYLDGRRDIDAECNYPKGEFLPIDTYRALYAREAVAERVVQVWPKESWQVQPNVYEDEDPDNKTPFEQSWDDLGNSLLSSGSFYQSEGGSPGGHPVWSYLCRADILSGIGTYGILLLGIDDGKLLEEPLDGVPEGPRLGSPQVTNPSQVGPKGTKDYSTPASRSSKNIYGEVPMEQRPSSTLGTDAQYFGTQFTPDSYNGGNPLAPMSPMSGGGYYPPDSYGSANSKAKRKPTKDNSNNDTEDDNEDGDNSNNEGNSFDGEDGNSNQPKNLKRNLLFLRCFDESLVQVVQYEANQGSPRFGEPVMYLITLNDPNQPHTGVGLPLATVRVHWSRVLHIADNLRNSEIFGIPRMQPVLNRLLDLRKIYSGSAEGYWKGALPIISLETNPQLGGDVVIDQAQTNNMMYNVMNSLQRYMTLTGMQAKTLAPQIADPTAQVAIQVEAICIQLGIPVRVFKGSERGELASSQDDSQWNDRVRHRQQSYLTPKIIVPFIDRLIQVGVLPKPKQGYRIEWPDLDSQTDAQKAQILLQKTQAYAAYVSGQVETLVPQLDYLTKVDDLNPEEAQEMIEQTEQKKQEEQQQAQDLADQHGFQPQAPEGYEKPEQPDTPQPIKLKPDETLVNPTTDDQPTSYPPNPRQLQNQCVLVENETRTGWITLEPSGTHVFIREGTIRLGPEAFKGKRVDDLEERVGKFHGSHKPKDAKTKEDPKPAPKKAAKRKGEDEEEDSNNWTSGGIALHGTFEGALKDILANGLIPQHLHNWKESTHTEKGKIDKTRGASVYVEKATMTDLPKDLNDLNHLKNMGDRLAAVGAEMWAHGAAEKHGGVGVVLALRIPKGHQFVHDEQAGSGAYRLQDKIPKEWIVGYQVIGKSVKSTPEWVRVHNAATDFEIHFIGIVLPPKEKDKPTENAMSGTVLGNARFMVGSSVTGKVLVFHGGAGSGDFSHGGRPGERGGSEPGGGGPHGETPHGEGGHGGHEHGYSPIGSMGMELLHESGHLNQIVHSLPQVVGAFGKQFGKSAAGKAATGEGIEHGLDALHAHVHEAAAHAAAGHGAAEGAHGATEGAHGGAEGAHGAHGEHGGAEHALGAFAEATGAILGSKLGESIEKKLGIEEKARQLYNKMKSEHGELAPWLHTAATGVSIALKTTLAHALTGPLGAAAHSLMGKLGEHILSKSMEGIAGTAAHAGSEGVAGFGGFVVPGVSYAALLVMHGLGKVLNKTGITSTKAAHKVGELQQKVRGTSAMHQAQTLLHAAHEHVGNLTSLRLRKESQLTAKHGATVGRAFYKAGRGTAAAAVKTTGSIWQHLHAQPATATAPGQFGGGRIPLPTTNAANTVTGKMPSGLTDDNPAVQMVIELLRHAIQSLMKTPLWDKLNTPQGHQLVQGLMA